MTTVRPPAVAGTFYPADPPSLSGLVDAFLAEGPPWDESEPPKALVVPHAGYVYSGPIAASGFRAWAAPAFPPERVVIVAPAHRALVRGLVTVSATHLETPLGVVAVDPIARRLPNVSVDDDAHRLEHAIEVQLPFVQRIAPSARVVPLLVGEATATEVGHVLASVDGGAGTRFVVSSDLSHYLPYDTARSLDRQTARHILDLAERPLGGEEACGAHAIDGLLWLARRERWIPRLLDLRNSGDTRGPRDAVVGYGAFAFFEPKEGAS